MDNYKFNPDLAVVFKEILPAIHDAGFKYWVFGGIGMAGVAGKVIREDNDDIDVYVIEKDYLAIGKVLDSLFGARGGWKVVPRKLNEHGRPKLYIYIKEKELFSMVPVYEIEGGIEYRAKTKVVLSRDQALTEEVREIGGYTFFSPHEDVIKSIFRSFIIERPDKLAVGSKHWYDAKAVFTDKEFKELEESIVPRV